MTGGGYNTQALGHCLIILQLQDLATSRGGHYRYKWALQEMTHTVISGPLLTSTKESAMKMMPSSWHTLTLTSIGTRIVANVNGVDVGNITMSSNSTKIGRVALISGWHVADFDQFSIGPL